MSNKTTSSLRGTNPPTRDANAAQRVALAIKLRSTKMTYESIAVQCGYSNASSCRKAVMRELDRCVVKAVDDLRLEELDSLERLELECWKIFADKERKRGQLFAVDRILQIKDARAKLMGLYTTKENVPSNVVVLREMPPGYLGSPVVEAKSE